MLNDLTSIDMYLDKLTKQFEKRNYDVSHAGVEQAMIASGVGSEKAILKEALDMLSSGKLKPEEVQAVGEALKTNIHYLWK